MTESDPLNMIYALEFTFSKVGNKNVSLLFLNNKGLEYAKLSSRFFQYRKYRFENEFSNMLTPGGYCLLFCS